MKLYRFALVVALLTVASKANGDIINFGYTPPTADRVRLDGTWKVPRTNADSKVYRWRFTKGNLEIMHEGETPETMPYNLMKEGEKQYVVLKVLGQRWAGQYSFFDDDTVILRLPRIGQNASGLDTFVLERMKEQPSSKPQAKKERQITVGRIVITGNTQTEDRVIHRTVQIQPG